LLGPLLRVIESREARLGVVGLGYIGLPTATSFAEAGFSVVGVDIDPARVTAAQEGRSYLADVSSDRLAAQVGAGRLHATASYEELRDADIVLICVPTALADRTPHLEAVETGGRSIGAVLKRGALVVLESTVYPGATEGVLRPALETAGLLAGRDFLLAHAPERVDPGSGGFRLGEIPRVVGGLSEEAGEAAELLYAHVVPKVVRVRGLKEAELTKLLENVFRHVNIALVNELAIYAGKQGIDVREVIDAAATKPFGYLPFYPGPGWGGPCIPLASAYLAWSAAENPGIGLGLLHAADAVHREMTAYVVGRISGLLKERGATISAARILGVGVAYKPGTEDPRESPGRAILEALANEGAEVSYHDPMVPEIRIDGRHLQSVELIEDLISTQDLVVAFTPQDGVDWLLIERAASLVLDCCRAYGQPAPNVVSL
jgi:UDP-N-acetyl-D-glucosamine dehydrogenase